MSRKFRYFLAGLVVWIRLRIPFWEAMRSAKEVEEIMRGLDDK